MRNLIFVIILFFTFSILGKDNNQLPTRNHKIVLPIIKTLKNGDSISEVEKVLGKPDADIGSGIFILIYKLDDGTSISVGSADGNKILYINIQKLDMKNEKTLTNGSN